MAGSISKLCERMRYWCEEADLGYDQGNRWDMRVGGESNCSSLVVFALREAGFDTGNASWTGDLSDNLTARGWRRLAADIQTCRPGDILLNDECHVCVVIDGYGWNATVAQASIDESGRARGGQSGDQTGGETNTRPVYTYSRGWDCILRYAGSNGISSNGNGTSSNNGTLPVTGRLGKADVTEWQRQCGTIVDGVVTGQRAEYKGLWPALVSISDYDGSGSALMEAVQVKVGVPNPTGVIARGTICMVQGWLVLHGYDIGDAKAGVIDTPTAKAIQESLNDRAWS